MDFGRVLTAMATPMNNDGSVNYAQAQRLAEHLLATGSDGLVVSGTTGETPTLREAEKLKLYAAIREVTGAANKPLIAGTSCYDTAVAIDLSKKAEALGADAVLAVTPQYNKPPQEGLYRHFAAMAGAVKIPVILYNVPSRTAVNLEPATVARLSKFDNIVALKEASGSMDQMSQLKQLLPPEFLIYSGDDGMTLPMLALGACGVISVASHLIGREIQEMVVSFERGEVVRAAELHHRCFPVFKKLFISTNPIPLKYALNRMGFAAGPCRLPLIELDEAGQAEIDAMLREAGLL